MNMKLFTVKILPLAIASTLVASLPAQANDLPEQDKDVCEWLLDETDLPAGSLPYWEDADDDALFDDLDENDFFDSVAQQLVMTEDALEEALDSGQSIAQIAATQGIDLNEIIDTIIEQEKTMLDSMVAEGELTSAEAEEILQESRSDLEFEFSYIPFEPVNWIADTLSLDEEDLWTQLEGGQSLNDIIVANNQNTQFVVDSLIENLKADDQKFVETGLMEPAEAETQEALYSGLLPALFDLKGDALFAVFEDTDEDEYDDDFFMDCDEEDDDDEMSEEKSA